MNNYRLMLDFVPFIAFIGSAAIAILGCKKWLTKGVTNLKLLAFLVLYSGCFFGFCSVMTLIIRHNMPFMR